MKPKTTLNLLLQFFQDSIQKIALIFLSSIEKTNCSDTFNILQIFKTVSGTPMTYTNFLSEIKVKKATPLEYNYAMVLCEYPINHGTIGLIKPNSNLSYRKTKYKATL